MTTTRQKCENCFFSRELKLPEKPFPYEDVISNGLFGWGRKTVLVADYKTEEQARREKNGFFYGPFMKRQLAEEQSQRSVTCNFDPKNIEVPRDHWCGRWKIRGVENAY